MEIICCGEERDGVIDGLNGKEAKTTRVLTIATITINDGMKWRSKPAPGAPLGQFDAQNLPNLKKLTSALKLEGLIFHCLGQSDEKSASRKYLRQHALLCKFLVHSGLSEGDSDHISKSTQCYEHGDDSPCRETKDSSNLRVSIFLLYISNSQRCTYKKTGHRNPTF